MSNVNYSLKHKGLRLITPVMLGLKLKKELRLFTKFYGSDIIWLRKIYEKLEAGELRMGKIEIFKNILDGGGDTAFVYNGKVHIVSLVYSIEKGKAVFSAYSFNDIEYRTIEDLLENAYIDNIQLKNIIPNVTDIYED